MVLERVELKLGLKFKSIGFEFVNYKHTGSGHVIEYKYKPKYLQKTHYTLIIFTYGEINSKTITKKTEYRLYKHLNKDGSFVDTYFQMRNIKKIKSIMSKQFKSEMRNIILDKILE